MTEADIAKFFKVMLGDQTVDSKTRREAENMCQVLMDQAHLPILQTIMQMLGQDDRMTGTMGNPVILADEAMILQHYLEEIAVETCDWWFEPPYNERELFLRAFSKYLYRFTWR